MTGITNNNVYMYHRHLVRVTDVEPKHVRVASSAGGVDEANVDGVSRRNTAAARGAARCTQVLHALHKSQPRSPVRVPRLTRRVSSAASPRSVNLQKFTTAATERKANTVIRSYRFGAPYAGQIGNFGAPAAAQQQSSSSRSQTAHLSSNNLSRDSSATPPPGEHTADQDPSLSNDLSGSTWRPTPAARSRQHRPAGTSTRSTPTPPSPRQLLKAYRFHGFRVTRTGITQATPRSPAEATGSTRPRTSSAAPLQVKMLRIGKQRNSSKVDIFIYCQQHAHTSVRPRHLPETAERLLRNYAIDPQTKEASSTTSTTSSSSRRSTRTAGPTTQLYQQRQPAAQHRQPLPPGHVPGSRCRAPCHRRRPRRDDTISGAFDGYAGGALVDAGDPGDVQPVPRAMCLPAVQGLRNIDQE